MKGPPPSSEPFGLTRRELHMIYLLCEGKANKEIAADCSITIETVKRHLLHVYTKIGVTSRLEAAMFAVSKGLVSKDNTSDYQHKESLLIEIEECHRKVEKYTGRARMLTQKLANPEEE